MPQGPNTARSYLGFCGLTVGVTVALVLIGAWPTRRFAGADALLSMLTGCGISLLASLVGAVPVLRARSKPAREAAVAALAAMGLRFGLVLLLGLATALSGWFQVGPLLIWLAISYMVLLVGDTCFAARVLKSNEDVEG